MFFKNRSQIFLYIDKKVRLFSEGLEKSVGFVDQ